LPHKDNSGPVTLECAIGIVDENKAYFSLSDPEQKFISDLVTGKKYRISGFYSSSAESKYKIDGQIKIEKIELLIN